MTPKITKTCRFDIKKKIIRLYCLVCYKRTTTFKTTRYSKQILKKQSEKCSGADHKVLLGLTLLKLLSSCQD